jgi:hypothetical protein
MKRLLGRSNGGASSDEPRESFHVFVAYDTPGAMQSAQRAATRLAEKSGGARMDWSFSSFDDLRQTPLAEDAAQFAASADMIVFATSDQGDLPYPTKAWVERWMAKRGNAESALIALSGRGSSPASDSTPAQQYLESVAREAGMDFEKERFELAGGTTGISKCDLSVRATQMTTVIEDLLKLPPPPHWGINE